jgi:hypothetical protein
MAQFQLQAQIKSGVVFNHPHPAPPRRCEKIGFSGLAVIPLAKAGIQQIQTVKNILDPGFHRGDE